MKIKSYYLLAQKKLFELNRSLTGVGVRKTLKIIKKKHKELKIKKIKSGTKVFDWKVPEEWNVSEAYILDKNHRKIIDFKNNNLHLMSYSRPISKKLKKKELFKHLYSIKNKPTAIPYVTSYYEKNWGFSVSENQKRKIKQNYNNNDKFKAVIKSNFKKNGNLNYGELLISGKSKKEILISTYICHPSMANNELSGPIVSMALIDFFKRKKLKMSLRFIFIPETIGSIAYINKNFNKIKFNVIGGFNLSCIGDERNHSCMTSKYGNTLIDRSLTEAYKKLNIKYKKYSFLERGSDERQFNSPGVDIPMASIFRTKYGEYKEYHTSLDNFNVVTVKGLTGGFNVVKQSIEIIMNKIIPLNKFLCEPQMGKHNLYPAISNFFKKKESWNFTRSIMDFLQYADGKNELEYISKLINLNYSKTKKIYFFLKRRKLIN